MTPITYKVNRGCLPAEALLRPLYPEASVDTGCRFHGLWAACRRTDPVQLFVLGFGEDP